MRPPNKTTEPVSDASPQGFIDYRLEFGSSSSTPTQWVEPTSLEPLKQGVFKGKNLKQGGTALALHDWMQIQ